MKRFLACMVTLCMLVMPVWAWPYTEGTKKVCVKGTPLCVTVPEKAPDMFSFPGAQVLSAQQFAKGAIALVESQNKNGSVRVRILLVSIKAQIHVVAMQAVYNETEIEDLFEDAEYLKTGVPSDKLVRVKEASTMGAFIKHINPGVEI